MHRVSHNGSLKVQCICWSPFQSGEAAGQVIVPTNSYEPTLFNSAKTPPNAANSSQMAHGRTQAHAIHKHGLQDEQRVHNDKQNIPPPKLVLPIAMVPKYAADANCGRGISEDGVENGDGIGDQERRASRIRQHKSTIWSRISQDYL
ncbi:hypothetical protein E4U55_001249 [Claviceps digitariae]|nr:hypothetical protein E4U55_001249 [Claviceps digitariae]